MSDHPADDLDDQADEFERFWAEDLERRQDPDMRRRFDAIRAEYRALAERNRSLVGEGNESNARAWRSIKRILVVLVLVTALLGYLTVQQTSEPGRRISAIQAQRQFTLQLNCAVLSGEATAGQRVISQGGGAPDTPFTRFLERHGYPPRPIRRQLSERQARTYIQTLLVPLERIIGHRQAVRVIRPDGEIDCAALIRIANHPRQDGHRGT